MDSMSGYDSRAIDALLDGDDTITVDDDDSMPVSSDASDAPSLSAPAVTGSTGTTIEGKEAAPTKRLQNVTMLKAADISIDFKTPKNRLGKGGMGEVWLGTWHGKLRLPLFCVSYSSSQ
jgi:hypothetical protein